MAKENVTTPMPFPPEIYYKQYTDEKVKSDQCPKPPKIPQDTVTIFGQLQVKFWELKKGTRCGSLLLIKLN